MNNKFEKTIEKLNSIKIKKILDILFSFNINKQIILKKLSNMIIYNYSWNNQ